MVQQMREGERREQYGQSAQDVHNSHVASLILDLLSLCFRMLAEKALIIAKRCVHLPLRERVTLLPRLPTKPFLNVYRTPFLQCLQQIGSRFPCKHQRPVLRLQEPLLHRMVEHPE